jgi:hypothetical protein
MKKTRKSRVTSATIETMVGLTGVYYLVTPYDKKGREIPSSVHCAYNSEYFSPQQTFTMSRAL